MGLLDSLAAVQESITPNRQDLNTIKFAQENQQQQSRDIFGRRTRAKTIASNKAAAHVEAGTIPEYFQGNQKAWDEYLNNSETGLNARLGTEGGIEAMTVTDLFKIQGKQTAIDYLNDTNLAPTYLGEGRYLDETNTEFGEITLKDGTTKFGIIPKIRTVDTEAEGGPRIYSADATYDGRKLRDIYAEGGDEAVEQATIGGIPMDFLDRVDADHGMNVAERGRAERNFGLLSGSDFGLLQNPETPIEERRRILEDAYNKSVGEEERLTGELDRIQGEMSAEDELYREAQAALTNPETGELTPGAGAFPKAGSYQYPLSVVEQEYEREDGTIGTEPVFVDTDGNVVEKREDTYRTTGADVNKKVDELFKMFRRGGAFYGGDITGYTGDMPASQQDWSNSEWSKYTKIPGTYPFNANEQQWNEMGKEGRERAIRLEKQILDENAKRWRQEANSKLRNRYNQHNEDVNSPTNVQDLANDKTVQDFYKAHMDTGDRDSLDGALQNLFNAKPELYQEYKDDPYAFALKYADDTNALYGLPVTSAEKNLALEAAAGANLSVVERAIATRDTETLLAEIDKVKKVSETRQKELVEFNTIRGGDHYRYSKPVRAATVIAYAASLDRDHPVFKALTNPTVLSTYLETGNFSLAQDTLRQQAEATQVSRDRLSNQMYEFGVQQAEKFASGEHSTAATTFNTRFIEQVNDFIDEGMFETSGAKDANLQKLGVLITDEAGRLAGVMERDPNLTLPENRNDFLQLMRSQAHLAKMAIREKATPGWWASWFYPDPNAEILEINPNVRVLDKAGKVITDPSRAKDAYQVIEQSSGDIQQISNLRNDFGISIVTHLITASRANELGIQ